MFTWAKRYVNIQDPLWRHVSFPPTAIYWYADNIEGKSWIPRNTLSCVFFPSENKNLNSLNLC